jgi:arsenite oxidase small subunit
MNNESLDGRVSATPDPALEPSPDRPQTRVASRPELSRRDLLKLGGSAAASAAALAGLANPTPAQAQARGASSYPVNAVGRAAELKTGVPVSFNYPDAASPCVLLKTGSAVAGGVGPQQDIVAYSILCTHRGCPVAYDATARTFKCPCHFSIFDPEKSGQQVCGQATVNLPQIVLDYDTSADRISAVAVDGLIYGRVANLLQG